MKKNKLWLSLLLAVLLTALFSLGPAAFAEDPPEIAAEGYCGAEGDGTNLVWTLDTAGTLTIGGAGKMADYPNAYSAPWIVDGVEVKTLTLEEGVTTIGANAFNNRRQLRTVSLPNTLTEVGRYAFMNCRALGTVVLPDSVETLGEGVFEYCTALSWVTLPRYLTRIETGTFADCCIGTITIPDTVTYIGNAAFYGLHNLRTITLPENLTYIGSEAFCECSQLQSVEIPSRVTFLGSAAFKWCDVLASVVLPDGLVSIGDEAFYKTALTDVTFGSGIENIGVSAFENCAFTSITLPASLKTVGDRAFYGCWALESVTLPAGTESVGAEAFELCQSLTSAFLPDGMTELGAKAFFQCKALQSIRIPEGVTKVYTDTLSRCDALTAIYLPVSLEETERDAFRSNNITDVYYAGTKAEWNAIRFGGFSIGTTTPSFNTATKHFHYGRNCVPGEPQRMYEIEATCTESGYYFEIVYCTLCEKELQSRDVRVDPLGHRHTENYAASDPTATAHGFTDGVYCLDCGQWISGHEVVHNTLGEREVLREPTEDEEGEVIITCTVCGERGLYAIEKLPSSEEGGNGSGGLGAIAGGIRQAMRSIIDWILRLIQWLGGN
ncbi:MAG: leucine-rich repeat domain-containing protein [Clostridia bacterium]|nr:leucine-rich repeat domain-containing protein [Clostridia bacterium]